MLRKIILSTVTAALVAAAGLPAVTTSASARSNVGAAASILIVRLRPHDRVPDPMECIDLRCLVWE